MKGAVFLVKLYATLFCHTPSTSSPAEAESKFQRQYKLLSQYAKKHNLSIEHCFFHQGTLNVQNPDNVLALFLCCAQSSNAGLILVESAEIFPIEQCKHFPSIQVFSMRDNCFINIGQKKILLTEPDSPPGKAFAYYRRANSSEIDRG